MKKITKISTGIKMLKPQKEAGMNASPTRPRQAAPFVDWPTQWSRMRLGGKNACTGEAVDFQLFTCDDGGAVTYEGRRLHCDQAMSRCVEEGAYGTVLVEKTDDGAVQVIVKRYTKHDGHHAVYTAMKAGIEAAAELRECDLVRFASFERPPRLVTVMEKLDGDVRKVQRLWDNRLFETGRDVNPAHLRAVQSFAQFLADVYSCLGTNAFTDMKLENVGFCGAGSTGEPLRDTDIETIRYRLIDIDSINAQMGTYIIDEDPSVSARANADYAFGCTLAAFCMGDNWDETGFMRMPDSRYTVLAWFEKIRADFDAHNIDDKGILQRAINTI